MQTIEIPVLLKPEGKPRNSVLCHHGSFRGGAALLQLALLVAARLKPYPNLCKQIVAGLLQEFSSRLL